MKGKNICLVLLLMVLTLSIASAITGSLGNSRVVLRLEPGESVEKYVLVKNVNDVPVHVNITVNGDLAKNLKLKDNDFDLSAGDEKKVYYTIKAQNNENVTETKMAIAFSSEQGNVGLISTIVVITTKTGNVDNTDSDVVDNTNSENKTGFNIFNNGATGNAISNSGSGVSPMFFLIGSSLLLFIMLIVLIVLISRNKSKKNVKRVE